jgi:hypothetical protein
VLVRIDASFVERLHRDWRPAILVMPLHDLEASVAVLDQAAKVLRHPVAAPSKRCMTEGCVSDVKGVRDTAGAVLPRSVRAAG